MFRLGLVCLVVLSVEEALVQGGGWGVDGGGCVVCKNAQNEAHCAQIGEFKECKGSSGSSSGGGRGVRLFICLYVIILFHATRQLNKCFAQKKKKRRDETFINTNIFRNRSCFV